ncbi:hypothetical protein [Fusibacter tunisiensis]|uniref:Cell division protein FtsB n=1 Tax=Fusibacter tunisiensis TaxID=1008308 RepID=A0ABS2MTL2_9FIRM|nr:hypothetical protein [Fusibacter tunisiensis]MBM7562764.1 cell division protein FtsB [Fusibacter tunisiensis]
MRNKIIIGIILFVIIIAFLFQKINYESKIISNNDRILQYENEISDLSMLQEKSSKEVEAINWDVKILEDKNEELVKQEEKMEERFNDLKYDLMLNNLSYYWNYIWEDIYKSGENISESQIADINFLLQPAYNYMDSFIVNPLSGYFASYYNDIKDIDLGKFLRYSPIGIIPNELPEIKMLSKHPNWPFDGEDNMNKLPVPIHRFERDLVQILFSTYAGINLDELSKTDFHDLIYLESTNAYYNYTSDFGPASFRCKMVVVEGNTIKLYGDRKTDPVLTIVKIGSNYFIKSHNIQ